MTETTTQDGSEQLREKLRGASGYKLQNHPFACGPFENPYGGDEPSFDELIQPRLLVLDRSDDRPVRYADRLFASALLVATSIRRVTVRVRNLES